MDTVVAVRLHAGILATTVGVPPLLISYDPKVSAFAKMLDFGTQIDIEGLTAPRLYEHFTAFMKDRERVQKILLRKREELIKLAEVNVEVVRDGLRIGAPR